MDNNTFKYFAFISYNAKDTDWGKQLQKKLEHYRMPTTLCSEHGWKRTPINPVFFAPTDIRAGGLSEELQERLKDSQNLIVICSPNSAKSEWVGKEIEFFHSLGRTKNIHFFIVDGTPHSGNPDTECFNPIIDKLGLPEILGANINEKIYRWPWLNRERAYVQLISKLLGVEFDSIWQRHKRRLIGKTLAWVFGILAVIAIIFGVWKANQPIDATLTLNEASIHNDNLPQMQNAIVTMELENETKTDTLASFDSPLVFNNIPHRFLGKPVHLTVSCKDFLSLDTTLTLTPTMTLGLRRDPSVYGDVRFRLWNPNEETTAPNTKISIAGIETTSDEEGYVTLSIPLELQQCYYIVEASLSLGNDTLHMPCGGYEMIELR